MASPVTPTTVWKRDKSDGKAKSLGVETGRPLGVQPESPKHDYNTQELGTRTRGRPIVPLASASSSRGAKVIYGGRSREGLSGSQRTVARTGA